MKPFSRVGRVVIYSPTTCESSNFSTSLLKSIIFTATTLGAMICYPLVTLTYTLLVADDTGHLIIDLFAICIPFVNQLSICIIPPFKTKPCVFSLLTCKIFKILILRDNVVTQQANPLICGASILVLTVVLATQLLLQNLAYCRGSLKCLGPCTDVEDPEEALGSRLQMSLAQLQLCGLLRSEPADGWATVSISVFEKNLKIYTYMYRFSKLLQTQTICKTKILSFKIIFELSSWCPLKIKMSSHYVQFVCVLQF